jgi:hypothetical protein
MDTNTQGSDRVYQLIRAGFAVEFLLGSILNFMKDEDICTILVDNKLMEVHDNNETNP